MPRVVSLLVPAACSPACLPAFPAPRATLCCCVGAHHTRACASQATNGCSSSCTRHLHRSMGSPRPSSGDQAGGAKRDLAEFTFKLLRPGTPQYEGVDTSLDINLRCAQRCRAIVLCVARVGFWFTDVGVGSPLRQASDAQAAQQRRCAQASAAVLALLPALLLTPHLPAPGSSVSLAPARSTSTATAPRWRL